MREKERESRFYPFPSVHLPQIGIRILVHDPPVPIAAVVIILILIVILIVVFVGVDGNPSALAALPLALGALDPTGDALTPLSALRALGNASLASRLRL